MASGTCFNAYVYGRHWKLRSNGGDTEHLAVILYFLSVGGVPVARAFMTEGQETLGLQRFYVRLWYGSLFQLLWDSK